MAGMSNSKAQAEETKELFEKCKLDEKERLKQSAAGLAREWLFAERKFSSPAQANPGDLPLWKETYQELVEYLKTADDVMIWYWLGQWFKAEQIRDPVTFFPENVLSQLRQNVNISGADIRNAGVIRIWLPYTEPVVRRARWLRKEGTRDLSRKLKSLGYDPEVIELVVSKIRYSPEEFTCEWVAARTLSGKKLQRETLVNSYSRYRERWWRRITKCAFCNEDADGEYWVRGEAIAYCDDHNVDHLPGSEPSAWVDRAGRRCWRDGLEIRMARRS